MMKELKLEDSNPLKGIKNNIQQAINLLRGPIPVNEFHIVLFLLTLQRKEVLKEVSFNNQDELKMQIVHGIQKLDAYTAKDLGGIIHLYDEIFRKLKANIYEIIFIFKTLDQKILKENFSEIFDDVLYNLAKGQGRNSEDYVLPIEISRFVCSLAELPKDGLVYNPFAGVASFGVFLEGEQQYLGQEINNVTWAIGKMRIMAHDKTSNSKWLLGDSVNEWNPIKLYESNNPEDILVKGGVKQTYDLIIANPPNGSTIPRHLQGIYAPIRTYQHFFLENAFNDLKPDGKIIALFPQSFLFNIGGDRTIKKDFIEKDLLDMVIALPAGLLLSASIPVSILVLNKKKQKKGHVRFVDGRTFVTSTSSREKVLKDHALNTLIKLSDNSDFVKIVSNETIAEYNFDLNVPRYFQKKYDGFPLGKLGALIRGERIGEGKKGKFIRIRDLKVDALDFQLNLSDIEDSDIPRHAYEISESCLLMAISWKTLKPTYFNYKETPIYITPDTIAFKVDELKCDLGFLIYELQAGYVKEQLDSLRTGTIVPRIRKEDLLSIIITIPDLGEQSLEMQKEIVKQRLGKLAEEKNKELILFNKIHGLENEIIEQNSYLRHTLAGPSSNLKDSIANIKRIIQEQVIPTHPHLLGFKLSDKHRISLGEYLSIIERDADKIVSAVTSQLKVDTGIERKKLIPTDIIDFMEKYSAEYNNRIGLNFKIEFDFEKEVFINTDSERIKVFILGNDDLLRDLFDNLINNAVKHAFSQDGNNRIEIFLMKAENEDLDEITILFSNTGKPFPEEFTPNDFIRKGSKFGSKSGDGFGGWYINEIIKKLKGSFDIIDETGSEGLPGTDLATSFEINFPIMETEENV